MACSDLLTSHQRKWDCAWPAWQHECFLVTERWWNHYTWVHGTIIDRVYNYHDNRYPNQEWSGIVIEPPRGGIRRPWSAWPILGKVRTHSTCTSIQFHILSLSRSYYTLGSRFLYTKEVWSQNTLQRMIQSLRNWFLSMFSTFSST
jgi:hypothetical protein